MPSTAAASAAFSAGGVILKEQARQLRFAVDPASLPLLLHESRGYLGAESERLLTCFARELGHTHRAEQVGRCDYYLSALEEQRGRLADSLPARTRTDSALCLSCALAAAILLW